MDSCCVRAPGGKLHTLHLRGIVEGQTASSCRPIRIQLQRTRFQRSYSNFDSLHRGTCSLNRKGTKIIREGCLRRGGKSYSRGKRLVRAGSQSSDGEETGSTDSNDASEWMDSLRKAKERQRIAVVLEVEGVLTDIHRRANREAFNAAFKEFDLDCANWTESVYKDLYRTGGGNEERMLSIFFDKIEWPLAVATSERKTFVKKCLEQKNKHLEGFIDAGRLPFRPGVEDFVAEAASEGVALVALVATSRMGSEASRKLVAALGDVIQILTEDDVKNSAYAQVAAGKGALAGDDNMLASKLTAAVHAEKQRLAEMVAEKLKLTVDLDTGERSQETILALRAAAEKAETPVGRCILVAGSQTGVQAAARISMPCVVVKSSFTAGAEFPGALATYGDYGTGSGLTLAKLRRCIEKFILSP